MAVGSCFFVDGGLRLAGWVLGGSEIKEGTLASTCVLHAEASSGLQLVELVVKEICMGFFGFQYAKQQARIFMFR